MKKVLFVAHSSSLAGGGEKSLLDVIFFTNNQKNYEVFASVPGEGEFTNALRKNNIPCEICPQNFSVQHAARDKPNRWNSIANADSLVYARKVVKKIKPDLIIINTSVIPWFGHIAKLYNIPVIVMVRELHGGKNEFEFLPNDQTYLSSMSEYASFISYNSNHTKESYVNLLSDNESFITYPVVSIPKEYIEKIANEQAFQKKKTSIIVLGNIAPHKNQLEVVRAIESIVNQGTQINPITLSIMGPNEDSSYGKEIKQYVDKNKLKEYVNFIPFSSDPYPEILKNDILIMASPDEAFGRVTVEAQLLERLVIGAASAGTLEIINDRDTGLLYKAGSSTDLASKITWAISHPEEVQKIAKNGRKSAEKSFSAAKVYKPLLKAIDSLLSKNNKERPVEELYYEPLYSLIEKSEYVHEKLNEYATSLESAIKELEQKQQIIDNSLETKAKRIVRKIIRIARR